MSLYLEFDGIVRSFRRARVRFAVAGGLAVGLHGFVRATQDMDFLVHEADHPAAARILCRFGHRPNPEPQRLGRVGLTLHRFWKRSAGAADRLVVDLLVPASSRMRRILQRAVSVKYGRAKLPVVSASDPVAMKRLRDSASDRADIAFLRRRS